MEVYGEYCREDTASVGGSESSYCTAGEILVSLLELGILES